MEKSQRKNTGKFQGVRKVTALAIRTLTVNEAIADALRPFSAKFIARKVKTSERTVEQWKQAKTGPQAKHMVAMLQDDDLCALLLADVVGRDDIAQQVKVAAARKKLKELEGG